MSGPDSAVARLVREVFQLNEDFAVENEHGPGDIPGWDSLGTIKLISAVEAHYDIEFELEEIASVQSITNIVAIVAKHR